MQSEYIEMTASRVGDSGPLECYAMWTIKSLRCGLLLCLPLQGLAGPRHRRQTDMTA